MVGHYFQKEVKKMPPYLDLGTDARGNPCPIRCGGLPTMYFSYGLRLHVGDDVIAEL